ncbi:MAG: diacylglycerol/polyprenol kinase family protein [Leptonema sp. (in: bacteria)]
MEQRNNSLKNFNPKRKIWHLLGLIIPILLYLDIFRFLKPEDENITRWVGFILLLIFFTFLLVLEIIRLNYHPFNEFFIQTVGSLMKESEYHRIHGSVSYVFANMILFYFFTKDIIFLSSLVLMVSDPIAAYFGIFFGKHKIFKEKTFEGFLAFFVSSFVVGILYTSSISILGIESAYNWNHQTIYTVLIIFGVSSLITSLVELFSFTGLYGLLDDNLTIPLSFAISVNLLSYLFEFPVESYFSPLVL